MSPFAVILYPDGRPVQPEEVHRLLDPISYAGPGGRTVWVDGAFGAGCLYPGGLARGAVGEQPVCSEDRRYLLIADARLSARGDLKRALGCGTRGHAHGTDPELLLAAWLRWGPRCAEQVFGDYAFIVYDRASRSLVGLTDAPGSRRLLCARLRSGAVLVASEEACLLAHDELTEGWAEVPLAIWLLGCPQRNRSIFSRIQVAACGEALSVQDTSVTIKKWWSVSNLKPVRFRRLDEYAAAYRQLLVDVVADRIDGATAVVCELSGGMDSSSVTAAARILSHGRELHVATVSHTWPGFASCDDSRVMAATRESLAISDAVVVDAFALLRDNLSAGMGPRAESPGAFSNPFHDLAVEAASRRGAGTILVGFGGDELTRGALLWSVLSRLAHADPTGLTEPWRTGRLRDEPVARVLLRDLLRPMGRLLLGDRLADRILGERAWQRLLPQWLPDDRTLARRVLRAFREAGASAGGDQRLRGVVRELHLSPGWYQLDAYRLTAAAAGVMVHAPLLDRRLVAFALGTPAHLWYRDGWAKFLPRDAFANLLPPATRGAVKKVMVDEPAQAIWSLHRAWAAGVLQAAAQDGRAGVLSPGLWTFGASLDGPDSGRVNATSGIFLSLWLLRRATQVPDHSHRTVNTGADR